MDVTERLLNAKVVVFLEFLWFALKFCYLFCGKLQEENRSKINKKLKQLMEKKDNMDEN